MTAFSVGVYRLSAVATDQFGAQSESSDVVTMVVKKPGYIVIGSLLISVLSILIPLIGLVVLGVMLGLYSVHRLRLLRANMLRESSEATAMAEHEFAAIKSVLDKHEALLTTTRKSQKLTAAESALFNEIRSVVQQAEAQVEKEVADVAALLVNK